MAEDQTHPRLSSKCDYGIVNSHSIVVPIRGMLELRDRWTSRTKISVSARFPSISGLSGDLLLRSMRAGYEYSSVRYGQRDNQPIWFSPLQCEQ